MTDTTMVVVAIAVAVLMPVVVFFLAQIAVKAYKTGRPRKGDKYYYIIGTGVTWELRWHRWSDDDIDEALFKSGNCYLDKDQAVYVMNQIRTMIQVIK